MVYFYKMWGLQIYLKHDLDPDRVTRSFSLFYINILYLLCTGDDSTEDYIQKARVIKCKSVTGGQMRRHAYCHSDTFLIESIK